jgi:hypothetical protein
VFIFKEAEGKHSIKCTARGGKWVEIEDYKNLSGWKQIPDIMSCIKTFLLWEQQTDFAGILSCYSSLLMQDTQ